MTHNRFDVSENWKYVVFLNRQQIETNIVVKNLFVVCIKSEPTFIRLILKFRAKEFYQNKAVAIYIFSGFCYSFWKEAM